MTEHQRAVAIVRAIMDNLYDRSGFDWWYDNIDNDVKREIFLSLVATVKKAGESCVMD